MDIYYFYRQHSAYNSTHPVQITRYALVFICLFVMLKSS